MCNIRTLIYKELGRAQMGIMVKFVEWTLSPLGEYASGLRVRPRGFNPSELLPSSPRFMCA